MIMDYGHVLIHVFYESTRSFYNLEGLWSDARRVQTESLKQAVEYPDVEIMDADESVFIE